MCETCYTDPEVVTEPPADDMIPALTVPDEFDKAIVVSALYRFGDNYITEAEAVAASDKCTMPARIQHITNMLNMTDRIARMIDSLA